VLAYLLRSLDYRSPTEYLISHGIAPKTLAENGVESGSASGAQAQVLKGVVESL